MKNQIRVGSIISYINILINMIISVFLTPFIICHLGSSQYGVYKIISSFSAQLGIITFGIASLVARNVVFYNTKKEIKEKENFLFMARVESLILAIVVFLIGFILFWSIEPLYSKSLTIEEINLAKRLFWFLVANIATNILCDSFTGTIKAHERFIVCNLITTARYIIRLLSLVVLLCVGVGAIGIVASDLVISLIVLVVSLLYSRFVLKERAKFYYFDKEMFKTGILFSFAVFLQAVINQFNNNLDNVILGAMEGSSVVTIYSIGLLIFTTFTSFVTVVANMYGPSATKLVANGANGDELTRFSIKPARVQSILALLVIVGFALVGRDFIFLWLGDEFIDVYKITLILIIPALLPLVESITNTILDAMLKRLTRSLILLAMCLINFGVSVFLIHHIGYIGAAFGTAFSLIIGHGVIMNVYLHKKIGLNIPYLLKGVFKGILLCALATLVIGSLVALLPVGWLWLILKILIIISIYFGLIYLFGINSDEKRVINDYINRLILRRV